MSIFDVVVTALRTQAAYANLSPNDIESLASEISQRIQQQPDLAALPESVVSEAINPTIQLVLAHKRSSIANVAQYAISVLVTQVAEDPVATVPEQYRSSEFCPYPGLKAFSQSEAQFFYGRNTEINAFLQQLGHPLIAITGPSGVGKSSFVYAGILPQLKALYGDTSVYLTFRVSSTNSLLNEFASFLSTKIAISAEHILQSLTQRDDALLEIIRALSLNGSRRVFLVIDQFEEIFVSDEVKKHRQRFLDNLLFVEKQSHSSFFTVILTARKNFLEHPDYTNRAQLVDVIDRHDVYLHALDDRQLRQALEQPLTVFNEMHTEDVKFQKGLIDTIVMDFRSTSVSLPLVQYLLRLMWTEKHHLSHFAYNNLGKLDRVLDRHASDVYQSFTDSQKILVDRVLLDLVRLGLEGEHTRKRLQRDYLIRHAAETPQVQEVVRRLSDERSRIISEQFIAGVSYIELTHEVLLSEWTLLRNLIELHKDRIRQREQLLVTAELWHSSRTSQHPSGDPSYLYRGSSLRFAEHYVYDQKYPQESDRRIFTCFEASRRRQRKNLVQTFVATITGLALIILAAAVLQGRTTRERQRADANATAQVFAQQQADANATAQVFAQQQADANATAQAIAEDQADAEQRAKEQQAGIALSRKLSALSRELLEQKFDVALLLSVEAYQIQDTFEAKSSLLAALQLNPYIITFLKVDNSPIDSIAFSPDGKILASVGSQGPVHLWDVSTRRLRSELPISPIHYPMSQRNVVFSPDGKMLASFSEDGIILWDVASSQQIGLPLTGNSLPINHIAFSPTGDQLVSGGGDLHSFDSKGEIILWDIPNHHMSETLFPNVEKPVRSLSFSPDGKMLAVLAGWQGVTLWQDGISQPLGDSDIYQGETYSLAFSPDGKFLAVGSGDRNAQAGVGFIAIWDIVSQQILGSEISNEDKSVDALAFSPDGKQIISNGGTFDIGFDKPNITLWVLSDLTSLPEGNPSNEEALIAYRHYFKGHSNLVNSVAFNPNGQNFASGDEDGNVILWNASVTEGLPFGDMTLGKPLKLGDVLYGTTEDGEMDQDSFDSYYFSQDDKLLIGVSANEVRAWDIATGNRIDPSHLDVSKIQVHTEIISPKNGLKIVAGDYNNANENISVWDLDTGQMLGIFTARARNLALSHDEKSLVSYAFPSHAFLPHPAFLWDIDIESWKMRACKMVNRNLTQSEWEQYLPGQPYRKTCEGLP